MFFLKLYSSGSTLGVGVYRVELGIRPGSNPEAITAFLEKGFSSKSIKILLVEKETGLLKITVQVGGTVILPDILGLALVGSALGIQANKITLYREVPKEYLAVAVGVLILLFISFRWLAR